MNTSAKAVIHRMKAHFARYGIPDCIVNDNGLQFTCEQFRVFTHTWGITHTTSSPHHNRANGKAESAVKCAKQMLRKAVKAGEDEYLALLNMRNTPTQRLGNSPAQCFLERRTKTLISTVKTLLEPRSLVNKAEMRKLRLNQKRRAKYYDRTTRDLTAL